MVEESEIQKLKSGYPDFFTQFSSDFLEFVFSEETSLEIARICLENGVEDEETIEKISQRITLTLLNQVPKKNLTKVLEKGATLNHETAEGISVTVKERVFSQIPGEKPSSSTKPKTMLPQEVKTEIGIKKPGEEDTYRELIE